MAKILKTVASNYSSTTKLSQQHSTYKAGSNLMLDLFCRQFVCTVFVVVTVADEERALAPLPGGHVAMVSTGRAAVSQC